MFSSQREQQDASQNRIFSNRDHMDGVQPTCNLDLNTQVLHHSAETALSDGSMAARLSVITEDNETQ